MIDKFLKIPKRKDGKTPLFTADFETVLDGEGKLMVYMACIMKCGNNRSLKIFYMNKREKNDDMVMLRFLNHVKKMRRAKIFFHNLGLFDSMFILKFMINNNYKFNVIYRNNRVYKIEWGGNKVS